MIVLGVDPGLRCTGYGVICAQHASVRPAAAAAMRVLEAGIVRSDARQRIEQRIQTIYAGVAQVIAAYTPEVLVLEELYAHYGHPRTAIIMGHVRGAICLAAAQAGIAVEGYAARKIKQAVTGNGAAGKAQLQRTVAQLLQLPALPQPYDVADALALAIAHCHEAGAEL